MLKITTPPPEIRAAWQPVWDAGCEAVLEFVSEEHRDDLRAALESPVAPDAPNSWLQNIGDVMARERVTPERLARVFAKIKFVLTSYRDQCHADPMFFPSPVGQELLRIARTSYLTSTADYQRVLWPTLRTALESPAILALPKAATRRENASFESWINGFRRALHEVVERWYRPMLAGFYRLERLASDGVLPPEVFEVGNLMAQSRELWGEGSPLAGLSDEQIVVFRNSEAHAHTEVDVRNELVTFRNRNKRGQISAAWAASGADLDGLARHVFHHGEVMRAVLAVFPLAELDLDPKELANAFTGSLGPAA